MQCPHCLVHFHATPHVTSIQKSHNEVLSDRDGLWACVAVLCPACRRSTIMLRRASAPKHGYSDIIDLQVWPKGVARAPLPAEVPNQFAGDYREACLVLPDSPKASAALSRRCLQNVLRDHVKVKASDLSTEIDELLASKILPSDLADEIDAIRNVGNFAAHPLKSTNTGAILDVEPGEAEWLLNVLENLFDFYFVRPAQTAAKRAALDKKLGEAGKPPMK
jgi:hypothetical protein